MEEGERSLSDTDFSVSAEVQVGLIARNKHDCLRPRGGGVELDPHNGACSSTQPSGCRELPGGV